MRGRVTQSFTHLIRVEGSSKWRQSSFLDNDIEFVSLGL